MSSTVYRLKNEGGFWKRLGEKSAVWWIVAICVVFSIIEVVLLIINPEFVKYFALNADNFLAGKYLWTILTHMFSHVTFFHLLVNMIALFSLGNLCERIIGRKRFTWFYLISGVFAGLLSAVMAGYFGFGVWENIIGSPSAFMIGASGAIFAIAGLYVVLLPKMRFGIIFIPFFSLPGYIMIPAVLVLVWVVSFFGDIGIGNMAHFGGFLAGMAYGLYLRVKFKKKVKMLQNYFR
ncbi:MAG: rhomboid family intramembrane serine protease [archaeon]|jgi:membrane associated rhomboid family serine protease|nr:rhomboid family intramembrane serine protease [archaeon]